MALAGIIAQDAGVKLTGAAHEKEVFVKVTEARSKVASAGNITDKIKANNNLSPAPG